MFGLLKSITIFLGDSALGTPSRLSSSRACARSARNSGRSVKLMKPGPATVGSVHILASSASPLSFSTISVASSRGFTLRILASAMAALAW